MPKAMRLVQVPGASKTIHGTAHAPLRYVSVANFSAAATAVTVYRGEEAGGEIIATVPANALLGWPISDSEAVTVAVPEGAAAPAAADQLLFGADSAHLPPVYEAL